MPANDTIDTTVTEAPTVSLRQALVMAGQLTGEAEGLLSEALAALDLTLEEPEGVDDMIAAALTNLNAAIKQVRAFTQARAAGVAFDRPAVYQINGGQIRSLADLFTLYGVTTAEAFARRVDAESDFDFRVLEVGAAPEGHRPGVRIEVRPPLPETVISRELAYPFSRVKWAEVVAWVEAGADAALARAVAPAEEEAPTEAAADAS
jgi:hypothetical protein